MLTTMNFAVIYIVVVATSLFVVTALIRMITTAAAELDMHKEAQWLARGLIIWPLLALLIGATLELVFPLLALMILLPLLIGVWLMTRPSVSEILKKVSLHWLVALSLYRIVGLLFLYLYFSSGSLTRGFAMNAGWGDLITGVLALPVAWMLFKRMPMANVVLVLWSVLGIFDLILAPLSAFLYGTSQLTVFPLNLVPIFLGPPFGILLHVLVLRVAWLQGRLGFTRENFSTDSVSDPS